MKPMSSLGGQSDTGRRNSARSSRASSTIFKKLRKLDSKIGKLQYQLRFGEGHTIALRGTAFLVKTLKSLKELDERRKVVRAERKAFHARRPITATVLFHSSPAMRRQSNGAVRDGGSSSSFDIQTVGIQSG